MFESLQSWDEIFNKTEGALHTSATDDETEDDTQQSQTKTVTASHNHDSDGDDFELRGILKKKNLRL